MTLFTCEHCGQDVPAEHKGRPYPARDHCPYCLWSKHVAAGAERGYPPCGAMMKPVPVGDEWYVWRCLGQDCGWFIRHQTDDYVVRALSSSLVQWVDVEVPARKRQP